MTDDELRALVESNARSIAANSQQMAARDEATNRKIDNLANIVQAFIAKLDSEGLKVTLITDVTDDTAAEVNELERTTNNHSAAITALREDAIADRAEFREQAEADRQAFKEEMKAIRTQADTDRQTFREEMQAQREESDRRFNEQLAEVRAQGEQIRALLSALATTNGRVDALEQAS